MLVQPAIKCVFNCFGKLFGETPHLSHCHMLSSGLAQIQEWTRQSLREKPFSTAKGKIWTMSPNFIPLEKIFLIFLLQKDRGISDVRKVPLSDVSQLFSQDLAMSACERILVTGIDEIYLALVYKCTKTGNVYI